MKITFLGAAKTVTGSCFLIETEKTKFLVDCGMFQGHSNVSLLNEEDFPVEPSKIDYIFLTHCHIDHSGRIPKIYNDGFSGEIYATKATMELCSLMLPDSGHIQEFETEWHNRKRARAGKEPVEPLYTYQDAIDCLKLFNKCQYNKKIRVNSEITIKFNDAGHVLGSSIIEIWIKENNKSIKIVFTGDLGNKDKPILRDPSIIEDADYLIIESTYGDRLHVDNKERIDRFVQIIDETINVGGNVIIPSFAVGRTQEIIYELNKEREKYKDKLVKLYNMPVFIDSPLAISATEVFRKNLECYDEEARSYIQNGDNPLDFPGLSFSRTADESRALNERDDSIIIISASGMCDAGRIKHHLKHNLWRRESTILFVGYQAQGTLGRRLVDGAKKIRIFGEDITVKARVEMIDGFSGHADQKGLLDWISSFSKKPKKIFIVHGEEDAMNVLSEKINNEFGIETVIPDKDEYFEIEKDRVNKSAVRTDVKNKFKRLAILNQLETLKEEFDEVSEILRLDLKIEKNEDRIDNTIKKLRDIEKMMVDILH